MKESTEDNAILSTEEMQNLARHRVSEISRQFTEGFQFLENYPKSVTFFGGGKFKEDNAYYEDARRLSARIAKELGNPVISGGGPGIMEAANRGAFEVGGQSIGLLIDLPHKQLINKYLSGEFLSYHFFVRKVLLAFSAEAFIFYPGGFGTLDEFFEILTLVQTKKITCIPIICVGSEFWNKVKELMKTEQLARGTITPEDLDLFYIIDDHYEIIEMIKNNVCEVIPEATGSK